MSGKSKKDEVIDLRFDNGNNDNKAKKGEVIDLIDDDDDDDIPLSALKSPDNDDDDDDKKPMAVPTAAATTSSSSSSSSSSSGVEGQGSNRKRRKVELDEDSGCMLRPKNPIKIFATDRDIDRRKSSSRNRSSNLSQNIDTHCYTLREMVGLDRFKDISSSGIDWIFITTFTLNISFLLKEIPELKDIQTVVICFQHCQSESLQDIRWLEETTTKCGKNRIFLELNPKAPPRSKENPLAARMNYGCHHTKMMLVGYSSGRIRLNIHTSNLEHQDIHHKCQAAFIQDFMPKSEDQLNSFVTSNFEETLITYLESYSFLTKLVWKQNTAASTLVSHLQMYDYSTAVGVLIPSIPGYHKFSRSNREIYGYLKVKQAIRDNCVREGSDRDEAGGKSNGDDDNNDENDLCSSPIVCQFSSMGSLSVPYLDKVATAWNAAGELSPAPSKSSKNIEKGLMSSKLLRIVWPTHEEISTSVEGIAGGGSVPGRSKNLNKDFILPKLHRWKSTSVNGDPLDKGMHVPHIKTYYQIDNEENESMRWFVVSSHNLSKAAWGEIQNRYDQGEVLTIQSWELGVFVSPSTLGVDVMGPLLSSANSNGHSLGGNSSSSQNPLNPKQLREQRLARFGGGGRKEQEPQPKVASSSSPKTETVPNQNNKQRSVIPIPYKFLPDKYESSDKAWVVD